MMIPRFVRSWLDVRAGLKELARVVRIEVEVLRSYDRAISRIGHPGTADQLAQFRNEHAVHVDDLFAWRAVAKRFPAKIREEVHRRHSGFEGRIALREDTEGALKEVRAVEEVAARAWNGLAATLPKGMASAISRFREDEKRHLRFLDKLLEARVWEQEISMPDTP